MDSAAEFCSPEQFLLLATEEMSVNSPPQVNSSGASLLCAHALQQNIKNHLTGNNSPVDGCFSTEEPPHSRDLLGGRKSGELLQKKSGWFRVTVDENRGNTDTRQGMHSKTENPENNGVRGTLRVNAAAFMPSNFVQPTYVAPVQTKAQVQPKAPVQTKAQVQTKAPVLTKAQVQEKKDLVDEYHRLQNLGDLRLSRGDYINARKNYADALRLRIDVAMFYYGGTMDEGHLLWIRTLYQKILNAERAIGIDREKLSQFRNSSVWHLPSTTGAK